MDRFVESVRGGESPPVAAIKVLMVSLEMSEETTVMGLASELRGVAAQLTKWAREENGIGYAIPVQAACELFVKFITRSSSALLGQADFQVVKDQLIRRAQAFAHRNVTARERVSAFCYKFVGDGQTVLVHGYSRSVLGALQKASSAGRRFDVVALEGRPGCEGVKVKKELEKLGIPCKVVLDAAVGFIMEKIDLVLIGAQAILENGGIINSVGTFPVAVVAQAQKTPVYVAAESFKFSRVYPLSQKEVGNMSVKSVDRETVGNEPVGGDEDYRLDGHILTDYTPPNYLSLVITELGVLTPSAISDELIKLYQ